MFFLALLGLHCCTGFSLLVESEGISRVVVCRRITLVAFIAECGFSGSWASVVLEGTCTCGSWTLEHGSILVVHQQVSFQQGMWDLSRPGIELVSPALACGFLTIEAPVKPYMILKKQDCVSVSPSWVNHPFI